MVWHRNSIGILVQRYFFSLIIMSSVIVFEDCAGQGDLKHCIIRTSVPLILVLVIVALKVSIAQLNRTRYATLLTTHLLSFHTRFVSF